MSELETDAPLNFGRLLTIALRALRQWTVLGLSLALAVVVAYLAPFVVKPIYQTEALVMYRDTVRTKALLGDRAEDERWVQKSARFKDMLLSRSNLAQIIQDEQLYPEEVARGGLVEAVEEMRRNVEVVSRDGQTLVLRFRGNEADQVYKVGQRLVDELKQQPGRYTAEQAEATREFLESQLQGLRRELSNAELELTTFLTLHPEFALDDRASSVGASIRAAEKAPAAGATWRDRVAALERQAARLRQRINEPTSSAAAPEPKFELSEADQKLIDRATRDVQEATETLNQRRLRLTEKHPDVQAAQAELAKAQAELARARSAARPIRTSPESPSVEPADVREKLQDQLRRVQSAIAVEVRANQGAPGAPPDAAEGTADEVVAVETKWVDLNRQVTTIQQRFEEVERRLFTASTLASVEKSGGGGQIDVIDPPYEPSIPTSRGAMRTRGLVFAALFGLGCFLSLVLALFDDRVYDEDDLKGLKLGPVAHWVPRLQASKGAKA